MQMNAFYLGKQKKRIKNFHYLSFFFFSPIHRKVGHQPLRVAS